MPMPNRPGRPKKLSSNAQLTEHFHFLLTKEQKEKLFVLGSGEWIRNQINEEKNTHNLFRKIEEKEETSAGTNNTRRLDS